MTPTANQISFNDLHAEVTTSPATECSMNDTDILAMVSGETIGTEHSLSEWYQRTGKPDQGGWGAGMRIPTAAGAGSAPYTGYVQILIEVSANGSWTERDRSDGTESVYTANWSPLGTSETDGDYEIMWNQISGTAISSGITEDVWTTLTGGTPYWSLTDSAIGTSLVGTIDISIRAKNAALFPSVTQRFEMTANRTS